MFELEKVCDENISCYAEYEKAFETDLKRYQSRIYPSRDAESLCWYHIKAQEKYIGSVWLEKNADDDFAVLGIFIADKNFRNKGIGKTAIEKIIHKDLRNMNTKKLLLRVREENERAIRCYKNVGFTENRRYIKNDINVMEMVYEVQV